MSNVSGTRALQSPDESAPDPLFAEPVDDGLEIVEVTVALKLSFERFNSAGVEMTARVRPGMTPEETAERLGRRVFYETQRRVRAALAALELE